MSGPKTIRLADYLSGMTEAQTATELEAAIQVPFQHRFHGPTWSRICKARVEAGKRICSSHHLGRFVPTFGDRRQLTVCGETYKVWRGGNSTGVRYTWHYAGAWAQNILVREGLTRRAAHGVWAQWSDYPHRCLSTIEKALAGKIPDPVMNTLIKHAADPWSKPINYAVEQNEADRWDYRANQPCQCGGTLFDWGAGDSQGFQFVNWRCNGCADTFTEYVTDERFREIRQAKSPRAAITPTPDTGTAEVAAPVPQPIRDEPNSNGGAS